MIVRISRMPVMVACAVLGLAIQSTGLKAAETGNGEEPATAKQGPIDDDSTPIIVLHTEYLPYEGTGREIQSRRLMRELVRQAFLIAIRHEMGFGAVDATLQETIPESDNLVHLALLERAARNGDWWLKLYRTDDAPTDEEIEALWVREPDWQHHFRWRPIGKAIPMMSPDLEEMSRKTFVEGLQTLGFDRRTPDPPANSSVSAQVEQWLKEVDYVAQTLAVREAHERLGHAANDPPWLAGLVRGYANLSVLTRHHWTSASDVFAARAILYGLRLRNVHRQQPLTRETVAYTWSLIGLHYRCLELLVEYEEDQGHEWARLARLYARQDREALQAIGETAPEWTAWATRLSFQITASLRHAEQMLQEFEEVLVNCPSGYGAYATMASNGGTLSGTRYGSGAAVTAFLRNFDEALHESANLPEGLRRELASQSPQATAQRGAGFLGTDEGVSAAAATAIADWLCGYRDFASYQGLSWSALGQLFREELFVQAAVVLEVSTNATETDLGPSVALLMRQAAEHRYAGLIQSYAFDPILDRRAYRNTLKGITVRDPRMVMRPLIEQAYNVEGPDGEPIGKNLIRDALSNQTFDDYVEGVFYAGRQRRRAPRSHFESLRRSISRISPHSELGLELEITLAREPLREQLASWEQRIRYNPEAFRLVGFGYQRLELFDDAIRCYKRSLAELPTIAATFDLAKLYYRRGNIDEWEQTHLDFVHKSRDMGLGHARVYNALSKQFAHHGDWQKAQPYAARAATTYAAWAMLNASRVYEALADWEKSEYWVRQTSEHYPTNNAPNWYFWCRRTGRGDPVAAESLMLEYLQRSDILDADYSIFMNQALYRYMQGDLEGAVASLKKASEKSKTGYFLRFLLAELADAQGDRELLHYTLAWLEEEYLNRSNDANDASRDVIAFALRLYQGEHSTAADLDSLQEWVKRYDDDTSRSQIAYILGSAFNAAGRKEDAERFWTYALTMPWRDVKAASLAGFHLAARYGTSRDDTPLRPEHAWPPRPWPEADANDANDETVAD